MSIHKHIRLLYIFILLLTGCSGYLDVVPKGKKIPATLADFDALILDEYGNQRAPVTQAILLLNDRFELSDNLNYSPLSRVNYMWEEGTDRIQYNNTDEGTYYTAYGAISTFNLIVGHAPGATEATDQQRRILVAQAKLSRAMHYYIVANYYADTYDQATAATTLSVPLIESADIGAPYKQVTIKEIYDYMLKDVTEALPDLPDQGKTILHGTKGAAYAFLARVYLQMGDYMKGLDAAEQALAIKSTLFDWPAFYESYKANINQAGVYPRLPSPRGYNYIENYIFMHGEASYSSSESNLRTDRAARFEAGDASFLSRWKLRTLGSDTFYNSITTGRFNEGGLTTAEVYLIKAECLARKDDLNGAMGVLNTLRAKRILPQQYQPLSASIQKQAINFIRRTRGNEMIFTIVAFADTRRFNQDPQYAQTLTKVENGKTLSLAPGSYMWTMPFPQGAFKNPGNGTIHQNVNK